MPIKWKQRTSNDWVWVSNGRPNEKYWLGKRKEKSLVFFTSKNGGGLTFDSLLSVLHSPSALLCPDDRWIRHDNKVMRSQPHRGGMCACVCVCVCVCPSSAEHGWMWELHVSAEVSARHSLKKNKKEFSSSSAEEGLEKGCREKWEG